MADLVSLVDRLPPPPVRIGGACGEELRGALEEAGYRVEPLGEGRERGVEAVVLKVSPGEEVAVSSLAAAHEGLAPDGRLVVVVEGMEGLDPEAGQERRSRLRKSLEESGFAVLEEGPGEEEGSSRGRSDLLVVARRSEFRVRPYREGDETAILDLFERAFHHRRELPRWRWAYLDDPYGSLHVSVAEDREGRLLAHYAGYPVRFWTDLPSFPAGSGAAGRSLHTLHVGDTMTAPEARRVGRGRTSLLTRSVRHFYSTFCDGRVDFNYGTNTGKIQRFSRRTAGAERVEDAPFRVRTLDRPLAAPGPWGALLAGWRVERVAVPEGIGEDWDRLWERVRSDYRFLVERDARYLRWRYACPDVDHRLWAVYKRRRLVGWSAFRTVDDRLFWGDALFDRRYPGAPAMLLSRVVAAPENREVRRIEGWLTERPDWWRRIVDDLGFVRQPEPEDLGLVYVPFRVDPGEAMARHLYYTKADFDLF